jgi:hypothetical protein
MKEAKVKIIDRGEKITLWSWENIARADKLPREYFNELPYFYVDDEEVTMGGWESVIRVCLKTGEKTYLKERASYPKESFEIIFKEMQEAGKKLHSILEIRRESKRREEEIRRLNTKVLTI